jgi:hypothetical protein
MVPAVNDPGPAGAEPAAGAPDLGAPGWGERGVLMAQTCSREPFGPANIGGMESKDSVFANRIA